MNPRSTRSIVRVLVVAFALALLTDCKPHEGGFCSGNLATCTDPHTGLWCVNGKYVRLTCGGPDGCTSVGGHVSCHQGIAQAHDRCLTVGTHSSGLACSTDGANLLRCNGTEFLVVTDCEGPSHCSTHPDPANPQSMRINCDESLVSAGDPCEGTDDACSVDHASMMECTNNQWRVRASCPGPGHCAITGSTVHCDQSVSVAGTPCDTENALACVADGSSFLLCRNHVMVPAGTCTDPRRCHSDGTRVFCGGIVLSGVGIPCVAASACSSDRTQVLRCDQGTYALVQGCSDGQTCQEVSGRLACAGDAK